MKVLSLFDNETPVDVTLDKLEGELNRGEAE